jgi:hypothetical protein
LVVLDVVSACLPAVPAAHDPAAGRYRPAGRLRRVLVLLVDERRVTAPRVIERMDGIGSSPSIGANAAAARGLRFCAARHRGETKGSSRPAIDVVTSPIRTLNEYSR